MRMIDYIVDAHGYTREQAYCLASVAVDLKVSAAIHRYAACSWRAPPNAGATSAMKRAISSLT